MFYAPLVMRDDAPEVSNDEFEQIVELCEIVKSPQDWMVMRHHFYWKNKNEN